MPLRTLVRQPSAIVPVVFSCLALAVLAWTAATGALDRTSDEGTAAHLWQLFIASSIFGVAYFAIVWLPREPRPAAVLLVVQVCLLLTALAPVLLLRL